jgi:dienelactone hydrolase
MLAALMSLNLIRASAAAPPSEHWTLLSEAELQSMQQAYVDRMAAPRNPHAATLAEWETRRAVVRRHVLESLGLVPEPKRLPLNVRVSGQLGRDGYVIKRVYWQTWPSYYASGYLYLPKGLAGKAPGILNPHGHWENGARNPVVQARMIGLARKGYVALSVDSVHAYDYYSGVTPLTVMTWNNIRGIDLLCSLPEVDPERIGCTGCSGGGQQTFYLMCVEDRLKAAVPVNLVSEARRIISSEMHHCPCNHVAGFLAETDETEASAVFAPQPALYICVTQDWTKWFPQEGYPEIRAIHHLYGASDKVNCIQHDWHHDYSQPMREQAYEWFNRWLKGIDDPDQAKEGEVQPESLETLATLDGPPPEARGPEAIFEERRASRAPSPPLTASAVPGRLRALFREPDSLCDPNSQVVGRESLEGVLAIRVLIHTEPDTRVPVVLLLPEQRNGRLPAVVVTSGEGKAAVLSSQWDVLMGLVRQGTCVAVADVRLFGEWSYRADIQRLNGIFFGRPPAALAAHDLLAVASWLRGRPEVAPSRVGLVGFGDAGAAALMAAAMESQVAFVAAPEIGKTYAEGRTEPVASHLVTIGDLPDIAAGCAPRPVATGAEVADVWQWVGQAAAE